MPLAPEKFDDLLQLLTICGVAVSFWWGVYQWRATNEATSAQRRLEATKPFLTKQLELYGEATKVAANLATSPDEAERVKLKKRFWELYWGELGLVENSEVASAMVNFGDALKASAAPEVLQSRSLELAHAVRSSLDDSWGTNAWSRM